MPVSTFWIDDETQAIKDAVQDKVGSKGWSQWVRDAIKEKANRESVSIYQEPVQEIDVDEKDEDDDMPF